MSTLKVPSLQHLARLWRAEPQAIRRSLINLVNHGPTFSYAVVYDAVRDLLVLSVPYELVVAGMNRIKREDIRRNFLGLLPLVREYFDGVSASFVQSVAPRYYPVGRNLTIPFQPPLIYGSGGKIFFPWFSFWRSNPLKGEALSLFVTVVEEVLLQDADLEEAEFEILDFSAPDAKSERTLKIINARDIPRVSDRRKMEMLSIFAEGFHLATAEIQNRPTDSAAPKPKDSDDQQTGLFDF